MNCQFCGSPVESGLRSCCREGRDYDKARRFSVHYGLSKERIVRYLQENPQTKFTGASFVLETSLEEWLRSLTEKPKE